MIGEIQKHLWADLAAAPELPGIYAWYSRPQISDYDLEETIGSIKACRDIDKSEAERLARTLLDNRVFKCFREEAYRATVEGPLKPSYRGTLEHDFEVSAGLISRIVDDPDRLNILRDILEQSAPMFASPLYIGMSINLRDRLARHKSLIERYRQTQLTEAPRPGGSDAGFAWQIAKRQISPDRLFAFTCVTGQSDEKIATDIENILNRLYYPILGRN